MHQNSQLFLRRALRPNRRPSSRLAIAIRRLKAYECSWKRSYIGGWIRKFCLFKTSQMPDAELGKMSISDDGELWIFLKTSRPEERF